MNNSYSILGIPNFSDIQTVKKTYHNLSRKYHPDSYVNSNDEEKQTNIEKFREINDAYQKISDEAKKAEYDRQLKASLSKEKIFERFYNSLFNESDFSFFAGNQEFIKRELEIKRKKEVLEKKLSSREEEIRVSCVSKVSAMKKLLGKLYDEVEKLNTDIMNAQQQLMWNYNQLSDLHDKILYKIMPSKYKNSEDKLKKEIEKLRSDKEYLENKFFKKKEEANILYKKILFYESDTIDNDSEVIQLRKEINNLKEQLDNLYRGGKSK